MLAFFRWNYTAARGIAGSRLTIGHELNHDEASKSQY